MKNTVKIKHQNGRKRGKIDSPKFTPGFYWGSCYSIFMCMFCKSLFVILSFFICSMCCLISSNSYYMMVAIDECFDCQAPNGVSMDKITKCFLKLFHQTFLVRTAAIYVFHGNAYVIEYKYFYV